MGIQGGGWEAREKNERDTAAHRTGTINLPHFVAIKKKEEKG